MGASAVSTRCASAASPRPRENRFPEQRTCDPENTLRWRRDIGKSKDDGDHVRAALNLVQTGGRFGAAERAGEPDRWRCCLFRGAAGGERQIQGGKLIIQLRGLSVFFVRNKQPMPKTPDAKRTCALGSVS